MHDVKSREAELEDALIQARNELKVIRNCAGFALERVQGGPRETFEWIRIAAANAYAASGKVLRREAIVDGEKGGKA
jgi:hypothetical protein